MGLLVFSSIGILELIIRIFILTRFVFASFFRVFLFLNESFVAKRFAEIFPWKSIAKIILKDIHGE